MTLARWSMSLVAVVALAAITVASAIIWLLFADPVTVANTASAAAKGDWTPMAQAIGTVIANALRGLFRFI